MTKEELLNKFFDKFVNNYHSNLTGFMGRSWLGFGEEINYGSYNYVSLNELIGRTFLVTYWDYAPGIHFLDEYHRNYPYPSTKCPGNTDDIIAVLSTNSWWYLTNKEWPIIRNFSGDLNVELNKLKEI